jgi:hypothetical protein
LVNNSGQRRKVIQTYWWNMPAIDQSIGRPARD